MNTAGESRGAHAAEHALRWLCHLARGLNIRLPLYCPLSKDFHLPFFTHSSLTRLDDVRRVPACCPGLVLWVTFPLTINRVVKRLITILTAVFGTSGTWCNLCELLSGGIRSVNGVLKMRNKTSEGADGAHPAAGRSTRRTSTRTLSGTWSRRATRGFQALPRLVNLRLQSPCRRRLRRSQAIRRVRRSELVALPMRSSI